MKTKHLAIIHSMLLAASLTLQPAAARGQSNSPSELLEKGIYAEETKGDIEGAITIYQQLVADAKANQSLAAKAQLRLGQCLLKKNRQNEAMAAFEKLVRDFPNEKELIAKAREYLPGEIALEPVPWVDGERLQMNIKLAAGLDIGTVELRADLVETGGRKAWRVGRRMAGGGHMLSSVDVDPESFHPLASYWKHTLLGGVSAIFKPGEVEMLRDGTTEPTKIHPEKAVFDNEEVMHMLRRLPLQVGYKTTFPIITTLGGGTVLPIVVEVPKKETVETPAGTFECFKVALSIGQTFWISDDQHRYLVKFDANSAIANLTSITQRKPGAAVAFRDDTSGVTLTTPPDWVIHLSTNDKPVVHLLDPSANAEHLGLVLVPTDSIPNAARQSARALADHDFRENLQKTLKDVKVRPNSWKPYGVSGRTGVSCVADYVEGDKPRVMFSLYAIGPKTCENFVLVSAPEKLVELQSEFDKIIASYRMTK
jgi:Protein of unknown function (DUF3108)/Tetratricopeptide repeat